jgi:hypothetical protein
VSLDEDPVAPVFILRDLASEAGNAPRTHDRIADSQLAAGYADIIDAGLISLDNAILLVTM